MEQMYLLAADIGATHSRFAVFSLDGTEKHLPPVPGISLVAKQWFSTPEQTHFAGLLNAAREWSAAAGFPSFCGISLAVPGPVHAGRCAPPNISWTLDMAVAREMFSTARVWMLNDFVAQGHSCALLDAPGNPLGVKVVRGTDAKEEDSGTLRSLAVVGAGTGFGKALLLCDPYCVVPSEGGHADFPFQGEEEFAFMRYLSEQLARKDPQRAENHLPLEMEMVVSGGGLAHILAYHGGKTVTPKEATSYMVSPTGRKDPSVRKALAWFARFYGRVCKNFLLETMAAQGLCIAGGLASYLPVLEQPEFFQALHESATHRPLLEKIPVYHLTDQEAGLWGAAWYAAMRWRETPAL